MDNDGAKKLAKLIDEVSFYCCFIFAFTVGFIGGIEYFLAFLVSWIVNILSSYYLDKLSDMDQRGIRKYAIYLRFLGVILFSYLYFEFIY